MNVGKRPFGSGPSFIPLLCGRLRVLFTHHATILAVSLVLGGMSSLSRAQATSTSIATLSTTTAATTPQRHERAAAEHMAQATHHHEMAKHHQAQAAAYRGKGLIDIGALHDAMTGHHKKLAAEHKATALHHAETAGKMGSEI